LGEEFGGGEEVVHEVVAEGVLLAEVGFVDPGFEDGGEDGEGIAEEEDEAGVGEDAAEFIDDEVVAGCFVEEKCLAGGGEGGAVEVIEEEADAFVVGIFAAWDVGEKILGGGVGEGVGVVGGGRRGGGGRSRVRRGCGFRDGRRGPSGAGWTLREVGR
jgi:hypothetical protein